MITLKLDDWLAICNGKPARFADVLDDRLSITFKGIENVTEIEITESEYNYLCSYVDSGMLVELKR